MFITTEMKTKLIESGFGESHIAVLCDWYQESLEAFKKSGDEASRGECLFTCLEDIRDDQEALSLFIIENMYKPAAHHIVLNWCFRGIVPPVSDLKMGQSVKTHGPGCNCPVHAIWEELPYGISSSIIKS